VPGRRVEPVHESFGGDRLRLAGLAGGQGDPVRGTVVHPVLGLEEGDDRGVLGQAAGTDQLDPVADRPAVPLLDIADLGLDALFCARHWRASDLW